VFIYGLLTVGPENNARDVFGTDDPVFVKNEIGPGWDRFMVAADKLKVKSRSALFNLVTEDSGELLSPEHAVSAININAVSINLMIFVMLNPSEIVILSRSYLLIDCLGQLYDFKFSFLAVLCGLPALLFGFYFFAFLFL